jgi:peptidyl-prolyl cis-trans isomerase SurA
MTRIIAVFFLLLLASITTSLRAETVLLDKVLAIVDDDIVMQSELDHRIRTISLRLQAQGTALPPSDVMQQRVLDQLILENIQLQMAEMRGIRISDDELNQTMDNIIRANGLTLESFEQQLAQEGETYASARAQIRRDMIISRLQQGEVERRVRITDQEVENFLKSREGRSQSGTEYYLGHILIAIPEGATPEQTAEQLKRAESVLAELRGGADFQQVAVAKSDGRQALSGGIIGWRKETELPSIAAAIVPSLNVGQTTDLLRTGSGFHIIAVLDKRAGAKQMVEQTRARHILISPNTIRSEEEAQAMINKLAERLKKGDDFAELARANSDDKVSAVDGGDLDWISPGQMVPEFEQMMNKTPVGGTSEPFRSSFGWHIVQVQEKREQDVGAEMLSNQARQILFKRKFEDELSSWLLEIKGESYIEIKGQEPEEKEVTEESASDADAEDEDDEA